MIAHGRTESRRSPTELGCDSLAYLSLDGVYEAIGSTRATHCDACFTGDYPLERTDTANGKFALEELAVIQLAVPERGEGLVRVVVRVEPERPPVPEGPERGPRPGSRQAAEAPAHLRAGRPPATEAAPAPRTRSGSKWNSPKASWSCRKKRRASSCPRTTVLESSHEPGGPELHLGVAAASSAAIASSGSRRLVDAAQERRELAHRRAVCDFSATCVKGLQRAPSSRRVRR